MVRIIHKLFSINAFLLLSLFVNAQTWQTICTQLNVLEDFTSISVAQDSILVISGSEGTIIKSSDKGKTWALVRQKTEGEVNEELYTININNNGKGICGGINTDIYTFLLTTDDFGDTWDQYDDTTANAVFKILSSACPVGDRFFLSGKKTGGGVGTPPNANLIYWMSDDIINTWSKKQKTIQPIPYDVNPVGNEIYFFDDSTGYICVGEKVILKTTDTGNTWQQMDLSALTAAPGLSYKIQDIHFISKDTGFAVCHYGGGTPSDVSRLIWSTDGGATWGIKFGIPPPAILPYYYNAITFTTSGNEGYIVGSKGIIFKSVDRGLNWIREDAPTNSSLNEIIALEDNTIIAIGNDANIFVKSATTYQNEPVFEVSNTNACQGERIKVVNCPDVDTCPKKFAWYVDEVFVSADQHPEIPIYSEPGTKTIKLVTYTICEDEITKVIDTISIKDTSFLVTVVPAYTEAIANIQDTTILVGSTIEFISQSLHADSVDWELNDVVQTVNTQWTNIFNTIGTYMIRLNAYGKNCNAYDNETILVEVVNALNIAEADFRNFILYPNPATNFIYLGTNNIKTDGDTIRWTIISATGAKMLEGILLSGGIAAHRINIDLLPAGTYILELKIKHILSGKPFVKF